MAPIKLTALRDFAIEHLPRAQRVRDQKHASQDDFHVALYGTAVLALGSPTASAIEHAAASLLRTIMALSIEWDAENQPSSRQRHELSHEAIAAASNLRTLTNTSLPWLTDAMTHEPPPLPEIPPAPAQQLTTRRPAPPPDVVLTTKEAAELLNKRPQTLHKWASQENGPLRPVRNGTRHLGWLSNDVIRVMHGK